MKPGIILVTGGARSGKSAFAQELAMEIGGPVVYIATAEGRDPEMRDRIIKHQAARPSSWQTVEAPLDLAEAIRSASINTAVVLIDCLTLFVNNLFLQELGPLDETENPAIDPRIETKIETKIEGIIQAAQSVSTVIIFVSNEVGAGLVPPYNLGRSYRDVMGRVNQQIAKVATQIFWVNCGLALELKSLAVTPKQAITAPTGSILKHRPIFQRTRWWRIGR
ncbi:MAG: bifunctional adenosylcobinamide kinase/adenosylcobinamide-phosphate guanylyltransferase [Firmicutes bacterium]|nr:bifunctional adenosylcobinamide kinase/adenosylcobinamide-phosphate guanylyltransferase [Bacillota bacterium]